VAIKFKNKALIFSMISIMMSLLFVILFSAYVHVPLDQRSKIEQTSVIKMESFIDLFPYYVGIAIEEATYEAIEYFMEDIPLDDGTFLNKLNYCLKYGMDDTFQNCSVDGIKNFTLPTILQNIAMDASKIYRGQCTTRVVSIQVNQTEPYRLDVNAKIKLIFEKQPSWIWHIDFNISKKVSLIGVVDPIAKQKGIDERIIKFGEDDLFSKSDFNGDMSLIKDYIDNKYTFIDFDAPSFVDAMEGNIEIGSFNASKRMGLNSFVGIDAPYKPQRSFFTWDYAIDTPYSFDNLALIKYSRFEQEDMTFYTPDLAVKLNIPSQYIILANDCNCNLLGCDCP
jgi:hypothetical protein